MPIELRILGGARAGQRASFDQSMVSIGRHPLSDLRLEPNADLEVSARHAEIRREASRFTIHDNDSTNGTLVNGAHIGRGGSRELRDGDVITLGVSGPQVAFGIAPARRPRTTERVAIAVRSQTRGLRILLVGVGMVLGALALGGWWMGMREAAGRDAEIRRLIAANEASSRAFQARLDAVNDTALINDLRRRNDSLARRAQDDGRADATQSAAIRSELTRSSQLQRAFLDMDLPAVRQANNRAIVLITSYIGGRGLQASGFCVAPKGYVVTSRHVVVEQGTGARATQIIVQFADSRETHHAHVVRLADGKDSNGRDVDLALLKIDDAGAYPVVRGIGASVDVPVGSTIATLGFPLGSDTTTEGAKEIIPTTTLAAGLISKSVSDLLEIDSFAGHGSSGSPVFDAHGHVLGVIWGGPAEARGRIVYAVPAERIRDFLPAEVRQPTAR